MTAAPYADATAAQVRALCRAGVITGPTAGMAEGYVQANLVILPQRYAAEFEEFCKKNSKPCPLIEVTQPGIWAPAASAPGADLRRDLPRYRVIQHGAIIDRPTHIVDRWRDDFVAFLIGCSFTFDHALRRAGLPVRHVEEGANVPMYRTSRHCEPVGPFTGPLIVSMRPMTQRQAESAARISQDMTDAHGAPVHVGDPASLGIFDLSAPTYGDAVTIGPDELPVFWACGVTPMEALLKANIEPAITHDPGSMFLTDLKVDDKYGTAPPPA